MCVRLPFRTNFNTTHTHIHTHRSTYTHTHTHTHARTYVCKLWEKHFFLLSCSLAWVFLIGNELIPFNELKNIVYLWVACAASASRESRTENRESRVENCLNCVFDSFSLMAFLLHTHPRIIFLCRSLLSHLFFSFAIAV